MENVYAVFNRKKLAKIAFCITGFLVVFFQGCFEPPVILASALVFSVSVLIFCGKNLPNTKILCPYLLMCVFTLLGFVFGHGTFEDTLLGVCRMFLLAPCFVIFASGYGNHFKKGLFCGLIVCAVIGISAYCSIIPSSPFQGVMLCETVDGTKQLYSVFGYSNTASVFFGVSALWGIDYYSFSDSTVKKVLYLACVLASIIALVLTHSVFGIICFAAVLLYYVFAKLNKTVPYIIGLGIALLFTAAVLTAIRYVPGSTVISRLIYAEDAFKVIKAHPLGIGLGTWHDMKYAVQSAIYSTDYLHNGYLQTALELGVHTLVCYLVFLFAAFTALIKSKNVSAICVFILLCAHSFFDIDMAYGLFFVLLSYSLSGITNISYGAKPLRISYFAVSALLLASVICFTVSVSVPPDADYYQNKIEADTVTPSELSELYRGAVSVHDAESAYFYSCKWVEKAPKSQQAFNAAYESINAMYKSTLDEKYLTVSMRNLYNLMEKSNKSMNPLCRFLSKNGYIVLQ